MQHESPDPTNANGGPGMAAAAETIEKDWHSAFTPRPADLQERSGGQFTALLHPPARVTGVPFSGLYAVSFRGEMIVKNSRDPETDLARALIRKGLVGKLRIIDGNTGRHRSTIDVEKASRFVAEEGPVGPRFRKWRETWTDGAGGRKTVGCSGGATRGAEGCAMTHLRRYRPPPEGWCRKEPKFAIGTTRWPLHQEITAFSGAGLFLFHWRDRIASS